MLAIGALVPDASPDAAVEGTAFAVSPDQALTAFHCVGDRKSGEVRTREVFIRLSRAEGFRAEVEDGDARADAALLRLTSPLPDRWEPVPLGRAGPGLWLSPFKVRGFPRARPFPNEPMTIGGRVEEPSASIFEGVPAIQLYSDQAAAGANLHGYSGAPVLVRLPPAGGGLGASAEAAVGLIRWGPPSQDRPGAVEAGDVFACPVSLIIERWPHLRPLLHHGRIHPSAVAIGNFLHEYLGDSQRPVPFGGRGPELTCLDEWLADPSDVPYMLVASRPGRGKSALLAHWWERLVGSLGPDDEGLADVVFVPVSIRYELNRAMPALRAVVSRIAAVYGEDVAGELPEDWRDHLAAYLQRRPPTSRTLLVILDGIDEAAGWDADPSLFPWRPGQGVKVLVSARLTALRPNVGDWLAQLGWGPETARTLALGQLSFEETSDVIAGMGPKLESLASSLEAVKRLHVLCEGDPLVLSLYVQHLWEQPPADPNAAIAALSELRPGLDGFMARWWADQERLWGAAIASQGAGVALVFNVLSCALGPLERREVLELANRMGDLDGDTLDAAVRVLARFVIRETPSSYVIAHPRLAEYRVGLLRAGGELDRYDRAFADWGADRVCALREQAIEPADVPPYLVRHYGEHLERALVAPERLFELVSPEWREAWEATTDELNGHLADVDRAWSAAREFDRQAVARGESARYLGHEVRSALARAQATTLEVLSGELAGQLVRHGVWSDRRALSAVRHMEEINTRAEALESLAPHLSTNGARAALDFLGELSEADAESLGPAFAALVARLALETDGVGEGRALVDAHDHGYAHGLAVVRILPLLDPSERVSLLQSVREDLVSENDVWDRRHDLLELLAPITDPELAAAAFGSPPTALAAEHLRGKGWWSEDASDFDALDLPERAYALKIVAPWLPESRRRDEIARALDALSKSRSPLNLDDALESLAPYLRDELLDKALELVDMLLAGKEDAWWQVQRALSWIALLPSMNPAEREPILTKLVEAIPALMDHVGPSETATGLAVLASYGLTEEALRAVDELDEGSWNKADYLEALAPHLELAQVDTALEMTLQTRRETRGDALAALLARLASFGPAEARKALSLAAAFEDLDETTTAAAVLAHAGATKIDLAELLAINDRALRFAAVVAASGSADLTCRDLLDAVISFGDWTEAEDTLTFELFDELQRRVPQDELTHPDAEAALEYVVRRCAHERKADIVIAYLQRHADATGPDTTLELGQRLSSSDYQEPLAWTINAVADLLDDKQLATAHRVVDTISDQHDQAAARAALLRRLPAGDQVPEGLALLEPFSEADVELRPRRMALVLCWLPEQVRSRAIAQLVPQTLLDLQPAQFRTPDVWQSEASHLVPALELVQVRRIREAVLAVGSATSRNSLRAAIATRFAQLEHFDEAFAELGWIGSREHVATALRDMLDSLPADLLAHWFATVCERIELPYWRNDRARLLAKLTRRLPELSRTELWRMFEAWAGSGLSRAEILVDLIAVAPIVLALGGTDPARWLADRITPRPPSSGHGAVSF